MSKIKPAPSPAAGHLVGGKRVLDAGHVCSGKYVEKFSVLYM
jgi:hypothetical protein